MGMMKKYYDGVCRKKQEEIIRRWENGSKVSSNLQDTIKGALEEHGKNQ